MPDDKYDIVKVPSLFEGKPDHIFYYMKHTINMHRLEGPAVEYSHGDKEWWYEGQHILVNSQEDFERYLKLLVFE